MAIFYSALIIPPSANTNYYKRLIQFLQSLLCDGNHVIILGDFNAPDFCWSSLSGSSANLNALCDFVGTNSFEQLVTFPTHSRGNILDLIFCASPSLILNVSQISSPILLSDHLPIYFELETHVQYPRKTSSTWMYAFRKTNFERLNSFLLDYDFSPLFDSSDVEFAWRFFKGILLTATPHLLQWSRLDLMAFPAGLLLLYVISFIRFTLFEKMLQMSAFLP